MDLLPNDSKLFAAAIGLYCVWSLFMASQYGEIPRGKFSKGWRVSRIKSPGQFWVTAVLCAIVLLYAVFVVFKNG